MVDHAGEFFWVQMACLKNLPSTSQDLYFTFGALAIPLFGTGEFSALLAKSTAVNASFVDTALSNPVTQRSSADSTFISASE